MSRAKQMIEQLLSEGLTPGDSVRVLSGSETGKIGVFKGYDAVGYLRIGFQNLSTGELEIDVYSPIDVELVS